MIGNEFASFDGSIESFFDAAAKEQKEKKVALPNRKTWTMQSNGQKSIIYQSRKDFPFNEMRRRLLNCNVLNPSCYPVNSYQCCQLQIQCFKFEQSFDIYNENLRVLNIPTWKCDIRAIWPTVWKKCCTLCISLEFRVGNTAYSCHHPPLFSKECIFQKNYFFPGTLISEPRQHYYQES